RSRAPLGRPREHRRHQDRPHGRPRRRTHGRGGCSQQLSRRHRKGARVTGRGPPRVSGILGRDMDWQTPEDSVPSSFITEANNRALIGKPPASGAWREGDPAGHRRFANLGPLRLERGGHIPNVRMAVETWGELNDDASNALLVLHALTGDSHVVGPPTLGHPTTGWWSGIVGPGRYLDTERWFIVAPNMLGGCQGTTGPASHTTEGIEWGPRFPYLTIRDQVAAQVAFSDSLGIGRWAAV